MELVAVVAIIGVVAGIAVPTILRYRGRGGREIANAALVLRATLRAARAYAIQHRVLAGVFYVPDPDPALDRTRYFVAYGTEYYDDDADGRINEDIGDKYDNDGDNAFLSSDGVDNDGDGVVDEDDEGLDEDPKTLVWSRAYGDFGRERLLPEGARPRLSPLDPEDPKYRDWLRGQWWKKLYLNDPVRASVYWLRTDEMSPDFRGEAWRLGVRLEGRNIQLFPEPGLPGHVFDPTGALGIPGAIKAAVKLEGDADAGSSRTIEIVGATGRVRIR